MADTKIQYGVEAILEVKTQNNLLPELFPDRSSVVVYQGIISKRAGYDPRDSVRLICKDSPTHVRVIMLKNILSLNGKEFKFTPTTLKARGETRSVFVTGSNGKMHELTVFSDGRVHCDCVGFGFRGTCKHVTSFLESEKQS